MRVGFYGYADVWTTDVLNCGVRPDKLLAVMRDKFAALGGAVLEEAALQGKCVSGLGGAGRV